jgi:hypothetical protein
VKFQVGFLHCGIGFQHYVQLGTSTNYIMYVHTLTDIDMISLPLTRTYSSSTVHIIIVIIMVEAMLGLLKVKIKVILQLTVS